MAEPAVSWIELRGEVMIRFLPQRFVDSRLCLIRVAFLLKECNEMVSRFDHFVLVPLPYFVNAFENGWKTGPSMRVFRREVCSSVERLQFRRQKHGKGPATAPGHRLDSVHINLVDIGSFFAVYFDADKVLVHGLGDRSVFERFMLHDVTPVARRVPD